MYAQNKINDGYSLLQPDSRNRHNTLEECPKGFQSFKVLEC